MPRARRGTSRVGEGVHKSPGRRADTYHVRPGAKIYPTREGGANVVVPKRRST
jgi:hypothetical protein